METSGNYIHCFTHTLAAVTCSSHYCTFLATLGGVTEIGSFLFFVTPPKVIKESTKATVTFHCHQHFCLKIITNVKVKFKYICLNKKI